MPRVHWPLKQGRPCVEIVLTMALGGESWPRTLLADTGAGSAGSRMYLILDEQDCLLCDGQPDKPVRLGGAFSGEFPTYVVRVRLPQLGFDESLRVVGIPAVPAGFDGIACFKFLNRFTYGNAGDPLQFGLET